MSVEIDTYPFSPSPHLLPLLGPPTSTKLLFCNIINKIITELEPFFVGKESFGGERAVCESRSFGLPPEREGTSG